MGSPTIFSGKYTKLLTNKGILNSDGSLNQNDGPLNYIKYAQLEQGLTTGWSLGTTGTLTNAIPTGTPTFGSGASGNLSISAQSTGALRGSYSLQYASSAATTAGNMLASDALAIDVADRAKVLTYKFYYNVSANPTNGNFSGTSSNSFGVAVYDVTNSAWLGVVGNFSMTQSSGTGIASGTFQTNSTTASIRFVVYNANATTGAITLLMDDFFVGPQQVNIGPVVTDFQVFTGTSSWTTGTLYSWEKRIGDSANYRFYLSLSGTPSGNLTFNLPSGRSVDSTKILGVGSDTTVVGRFRIIRQGTNIWNGDVILTALTGTAFALRFSTSAGATSPVPNNSIVSNTSPASFVSGDFVEVEIYNVPISGWSSNVQMSSDSYQGVVAAEIQGSSLSIANNTDTLITNYTTAVVDTNSAFNLTTGLYTVPVSGYYAVTGLVGYSSNTTGFRASGIRQNGGIVVQGSTVNGVTSGGNTVATVSSVLKCNAGDTIGLNAYQTSGGALTLAGASWVNFSLQRISGPSVLAATDTVGFAANNPAAQTIANTSITQLTGYSKEFDTNGAFNATTGVYTVPVSGKYLILGQALFNANATGARWLFFYKNGSQLKEAIFAGNATLSALVLSTVAQLNAGDTIDMRVQQSSGGNLSINSTAAETCFYAMRVGN